MLVGAVLSGVACFLPFLSGGGESVNGFDDVPVFFLSTDTTIVDDSPGGPLFIFLAIILAGFGIATLAAGRLLAIMIIGIVLAAFGLLAGAAYTSDYSDVADITGLDLGAGLPLVIVGFAISLAGAITGIAKRRRWPVR